MKSVHTLALLLSLLSLCTAVLATVPWTAEEIADYERQTAGDNAHPSRLDDQRDRNSLDDLPYYLHFLRLMEFLDGRQFTGGGNSRGGMREGERNGNENIIETDNTQEAIREWSQYAIWSGDTVTYHENIDRAWEYCWRYQAWHEGDGGFPYYSAHNIGWGFEAVKKYREAYGDTSQNRYADSCAAWMVRNQLNWNDALNAYAEGLGLGGMYAHALYRGRDDWRNHCITRGRALRNWLQAAPARMRSETWALCGGTAVWGVCNSFFQEYPDSGATWLAEYGDEMDEWVAGQNWGNSFNAWYANAHFIAYELTGDTSFWNVGVSICDQLINLDIATDNDGGIYPGTCCQGPPPDDHSWVSAYMGWMGMERLINRLPARDLAVAELASPDTALPHLAGDSLTVAVQVVNSGRESMSGSLTVVGTDYFHELNFTLSEGQDSVFTLSEPWIVPDTPDLPVRSSLLVYITAEGDSSVLNDSLHASLDIRHGIELQGQIRDLLDPNAQLPCHVKIYHSAYQETPWTEFDVAADGNYTSGERRLLSGFNLIEVTPPLRYMIYREQFELAPQPPQQNHNVNLARADVLLVDDDVDRGYETYFISPLGQLGLDLRIFDRNSGIAEALGTIPAIVWFTGNDSTTTLLPWDEEALTRYLAQGGHLLLTGQNITDDLGSGNTFLNSVLHCEVLSNNTGSRTLFGVAGSSIGDSLSIILTGTQGANNQNSTSSLTVLEGSEAQFEYQGSGDEGMVSGQYETGKYVFCSFGVEAISGVNSSTPRVEFLAEVFDWFDLPVDADGPSPLQPNQVWLAQNYPNPFNASTTIAFYAPATAGQLSLSVYNLLGQRVAELFRGPASGQVVEVSWNPEQASGYYVARLESGSTVITKSLQLLR